MWGGRPGYHLRRACTRTRVEGRFLEWRVWMKNLYRCGKAGLERIIISGHEMRDMWNEEVWRCAGVEGECLQQVC